MAFIYDLIDPQEMQGFVRALAFPQFQLAGWLPAQEIFDLEYKLAKGDFSDEDAGVFRAYDAEAEIGKRQGPSTMRGELPPISRKYPLGEEARLRLRGLEAELGRQTIDTIYDDLRKAARAIHARMELARGDALANGTITISENGVGATINFGRDASMQVAPTTLWSNRATSDPIADMLAWQQTYADLNGQNPEFILISTTILMDLLLNEKMRNYAANVVGAPARLSRRQVEETLADYGLPRILVDDTKVRKAGVATRVIPEDYLLMLPPQDGSLGRTFFGVTAEALELNEAGQIGDDQLPGITGVIEKTFDPVTRWTKGSALAVPVLGNPDLVLRADVR